MTRRIYSVPESLGEALEDGDWDVGQDRLGSGG